MKKFTFGVVTYNHSKYIIEHLESIKFLINNYGEDYSFKLVIADDGSKDNTLSLIDLWLSANEKLFTEQVVLGDGINRGTCINYTNMWPYIDSELFKITAGDDVYSYLNIIDEANNLLSNDFISGVPLLLIDGVLSKSNSIIFNLVATDKIYKNKNFLSRLQNISLINTPSLIFNSKFLKNSSLAEFIRSFKVTEDFPMMLKIAQSYMNISFIQSEKIYIYYRRTSGSIYLVRAADYDNDKLRVFNLMLSSEKSNISKLLIKNRMMSFMASSFIKKRLLNFNYYIYLARIAFNLASIIRGFFSIEINMERHGEHYYIIKNKSMKFLENLAIVK
jgi:hypothetical protein